MPHSSTHLPILEVRTRQPSPKPIFPGDNKSMKERGPRLYSMNSGVGMGIRADADIRIQTKAF